MWCNRRFYKHCAPTELSGGTPLKSAGETPALHVMRSAIPFLQRRLRKTITDCTCFHCGCKSESLAWNAGDNAADTQEFTVDEVRFTSCGRGTRGFGDLVEEEKTRTNTDRHGRDTVNDGTKWDGASITVLATWRAGLDDEAN